MKNKKKLFEVLKCCSNDKNNLIHSELEYDLKNSTKMSSLSSLYEDQVSVCIM